MEVSFWESRWAASNIGFHEGAANRQLQQFWKTLELDAGDRVFVPLAGKSLDIVWLLQTHAVLANELSATAVEAFFVEQDIPHSSEQQGDLRRFDAGELQFFQGDYFALPDAQIASCSAVFDRAALVALPTLMRERYAAKMTAALPPGAQMLLITLEYDQTEFDGPPFAIPAQEVHRLYGEQFSIEVLGGEQEEFRGTTVTNRAYRLRKA